MPASVAEGDPVPLRGDGRGGGATVGGGRGRRAALRLAAAQEPAQSGAEADGPIWRKCRAGAGRGLGRRGRSRWRRRLSGRPTRIRGGIPAHFGGRILAGLRARDDLGASVAELPTARQVGLIPAEMPSSRARPRRATRPGIDVAGTRPWLGGGGGAPGLGPLARPCPRSPSRTTDVPHHRSAGRHRGSHPRRGSPPTTGRPAPTTSCGGHRGRGRSPHRTPLRGPGPMRDAPCLEPRSHLGSSAVEPGVRRMACAGAGRAVRWPGPDPARDANPNRGVGWGQRAADRPPGPQGIGSGPRPRCRGGIAWPGVDGRP